MKEATGNSEVVKSLRKIGWGATKLSDVRGSRFTDSKPCDILACSPKGRYVAIEGKMIKKWGGFNTKTLRQNQIDELNNTCLKRQGRAFVFLYVRINANPSKGLKRVCKLVIFDWKKHRKALEGKGYGVAQLRSQSVGVWLDPSRDEDGKTIWNLKKLLTY